MKIYEKEFNLTLKAEALTIIFLRKLKKLRKPSFSNEEKNDIVLQLSILFDMTLEELDKKELDYEMVKKDIAVLEEFKDFEIKISEEKFNDEIGKLEDIQDRLKRVEDDKRFREFLAKQKEEERKRIKMSKLEILKNAESKYDELVVSGFVQHVKPTYESVYRKRKLTKKERRLKKLKLILGNSFETTIDTPITPALSFSKLKKINLSELSYDSIEKVKKFLLNQDVKKSAKFIMKLIDDDYNNGSRDTEKVVEILRDKRFKIINREIQKLYFENF